MKLKEIIRIAMIPGIFFFIGLFLFVNFFEYAKTFYDINPGDIVGDVNFSTYPGAVYIFFIYLLFQYISCLLYTSPSPRDGLLSRMPSSA